MTNNIQIVEYRPEYQQRFKEINVQWITRSFEMEEEDIKTVDDPEGYILKGGGKIFIALYNNEVVGTCAYLNFGDHLYEMIKMAVDEKFQGKKIGNRLMEFCIEKAKLLSSPRIFLYSNTVLQPAIHLYRKYGFVEIPIGKVDYKRSNIKMEKIIE